MHRSTRKRKPFSDVRSLRALTRCASLQAMIDRASDDDAVLVSPPLAGAKLSLELIQEALTTCLCKMPWIGSAGERVPADFSLGAASKHCHGEQVAASFCERLNIVLPPHPQVPATWKRSKTFAFFMKGGQEAENMTVHIDPPTAASTPRCAKTDASIADSDAVRGARCVEAVAGSAVVFNPRELHVVQNIDDTNVSVSTHFVHPRFGERVLTVLLYGHKRFTVFDVPSPVQREAIYQAGILAEDDMFKDEASAVRALQKAITKHHVTAKVEDLFGKGDEGKRKRKRKSK